MTALLFDLDGTLVDSDADHLVAFQKVFAPHGIELDRTLYTSHIMGASNAMIGERFLRHLPEAEREAVLHAKEAAYREGLGALAATAGAEELLAYAEANGLPCAVVTNAPRANAEVVLAAIGLDERLPILVIGGELARSKPDPLPYLTALELTGVSAAKAVAFEDSLSGVRAAAAAGIAVVGITTGLPAERLVAEGAVFAVADFTDPRIYELIETRRRGGARPFPSPERIA
jgi:HAD superfamily hydrolase (TIGR01509 family)